MTRSIKHVAATLAWALAVSPGLRGETVPAITTVPNFWDEIPVSPSTTVPRMIQDAPGQSP